MNGNPTFDINDFLEEQNTSMYTHTINWQMRFFDAVWINYSNNLWPQ